MKKPIKKKKQALVLSREQKKGKWPITFKKCSTVLAIRGILSKTTLRFPLSQAGGLPSRNNNSKCWQGWRDMGTFIHSGEWKLEWLLWKSAQPVLKIPETELLGAICTLLSIYPKDPRSCSRGARLCIFMAALVTGTRNGSAWKPSADGWRTNTCDKVATKFYSTVNRNKIRKHVGEWMERETATQSEGTQVQKGKYLTFSTVGTLASNFEFVVFNLKQLQKWGNWMKP